MRVLCVCCVRYIGLSVLRLLFQHNAISVIGMCACTCECCVREKGQCMFAASVRFLSARHLPVRMCVFGNVRVTSERVCAMSPSTRALCIYYVARTCNICHRLEQLALGLRFAATWGGGDKSCHWALSTTCAAAAIHSILSLSHHSVHFITHQSFAFY